MNWPIVKGKATRQAHVALPEGTYEEEHGREGFFGRVSHLYHVNPPTGWTRDREKYLISAILSLMRLKK